MVKTSTKPKAEYSIQTVANALRMLEVFHDESEIGVTDLARRLGLHKNNVFRLLATLELAGYIRQSSETELYRLGARCLELGQAYLRSHDLIEQARPILESLCATSGETAHLGDLDEGEVIHLEGRLPKQLVLTGTRVGERLPVHCTALGKVLSAGAHGGAWMPSAAGTELDAYTASTIVDPMKLVDELRSAEMRGYAVDIEEYSPGLCCVAAPVRDATSAVVAAVSLSGPSFRLCESDLHGSAAEAVVAAASQLSQALGAPS